MKRILFILPVLVVLAVVASACVSSASFNATATAVNIQLNAANTQLTAMAVPTATPIPPTVTPVTVSSTYIGKWLDPTGDTYQFMEGGKLHAVASGKDYDTTYFISGPNTMTIDFGPILGHPGESNYNLLVKYVVMGNTMTITFTANNQSVSMSRIN